MFQIDGGGTLIRIQVPLKVSILAWRLLRDRLPTKVNLITRGIIVAKAQFYVSGSGAVESATHLFISCGSFGSLWSLVSSWIGSSLVTAQILPDHFVQFTLSAGDTHARRSFMQLNYLACLRVGCLDRKKPQIVQRLFKLYTSYIPLFVNVKAQDSPVFLISTCSKDNTTANSTFQDNLMSLLSSLSSKAIGNTEFYKTTVTNINPSDSVYGLFMCRGDIVPSNLCHECVVNATQKLSLECSFSKRAVIWYDLCMVRYSNNSFFSTVNTESGVFLMNTGNVSNTKKFMRLLFSTMNETADEAAQALIGEENKKFATRETPISTFQTLYCLAQCTPDLSPNDCRTCLSTAIGVLPQCCDGKQGGRVLFPSCNVRYELYPFYRNTTTNASSTNELVPETNDSKLDSGFSQDPFYLSYNCSSKNTSSYNIYLKLLLSYLSSNATSGETFYRVKIEETLYGLYMCRGDLPSRLCGQCVKNATDQIYSKCRSKQEGIIWYSHCWLRYSYRNFFSKMETSPIYSYVNISSSIAMQNIFTVILSTHLNQLATEAGNSIDRYTMKSLKLNAVQTLYTLEQCTQDLSSDDCTSCLNDVISTAIPWPVLGSVGGRILYPSCNLRFELFPFYMEDVKALVPTSPSPSKGDAGNSLLKKELNVLK
ncbi:hypothetical protein TSUD_293050 [Trifolium subterraneum]|uniref:Gnk2-homologous domain-containing protein n=1 Tax=Trifolium subterraneum TaxID=3900 RepID=A0A2Z6MX73_TRISU|nr:hypothetical protein TSUD_293050 [Trifolium subterraneum]